ncbi:hypothetical protein ACFE04_003915 [Oxalis oulophora]
MEMMMSLKGISSFQSKSLFNDIITNGFEAADFFMIKKRVMLTALRVFSEVREEFLMVEDVGVLISQDAKNLYHDIIIPNQSIAGRNDMIAAAYSFQGYREEAYSTICFRYLCGLCKTTIFVRTAIMQYVRLLAMATGQKIVRKDAGRFHHFENGKCSCGGYW